MTTSSYIFIPHNNSEKLSKYRTTGEVSNKILTHNMAPIVEWEK